MLRSIHPKARPAHHERKVIMASIKRTGNNTYQITVSCGYSSSGRKIRRKTTYKPDLLTAKGNPKSEASIEKDVAAFAAAFERKVLTGQYTEGFNMTFERFAEKYIAEYAEENQAPRTLDSTRKISRMFVEDFGYMTLENLTPLFLQEYANALSRKKKQNGTGTLSRGTVRRRMTVLSGMLSQAVRWNLLGSNPMQRVQIKAAEDAAEKIKFFTQEEAETFLAALENPVLYAYSYRPGSDWQQEPARLDQYRDGKRSVLQFKFFFYLAIFAGCRRGELLALTWQDFNFKTASVSITKSVCRVNGKTIVKTTKTRSSVREIALPDAVMNLAKAWKAEQARYQLMIGSQWIGTGNVFTKWNGDFMGLETTYTVFHRIIKNYNATRSEGAPLLPLIPLHGLRHTAATLLIGSGVDVRTVSGRLGHSNASTTLNIYSHALKELDRKAADVLANVLTKKA